MDRFPLVPDHLVRSGDTVVLQRGTGKRSSTPAPDGCPLPRAQTRNRRGARCDTCCLVRTRSTSRSSGEPAGGGRAVPQGPRRSARRPAPRSGYGDAMHDQRSTTNHRQEQKANTRAAILRAAATEFATRGYAGTSIASIAAAMGKPKSAVGHHQFASKQQIAEAIVRQQQETWASMRAEVEQATPPGLGRLLRLLMTAALDAREHPSALAAVRLLADQRANGITLPRSTVPWRAYVAEQFQIDIDAGRIPSDRPAEELARRLLNASFGVFDAESRGLQAIDTEAALRALWADLLAGVGVTDVDAVLEQVGAVDAAPPA
ncbi:hypothetical protein DEI86_04750 [Curtobacterium sp. MCBD17_028]|nr:hypothetical protein DEI86_04750 [Curtobacterium sp. MCBD17_028]